ncbi:uncharacterized protein LOC121728571 isoform X1 [Aricia agestis]|uniref:uncharacterized protein LOC121728571 isoform X1 n=1 Tax=Aricia agestis TaxID=91739 RepID=UPI001C207F33|nr:uncharacterized protein LOC121728571 isoform X1 [Aricia agestis]
MHLLMLLVLVGAVITEATSGVECPPGTVKMGGGLCEVIERRAADDSNCPPGTVKTEDGLKCMVTDRRAADAGIKDISDEPYCPKGKFYHRGDCVGRGRRAADVDYCPPGTMKAKSGQCIVIGRRAADVTSCPPGTAKTEDGLKCMVTDRRAADASIKDISDEPYCPKGKFYLKGDCVGRGRRAAESKGGYEKANCPPGTIYYDGLCRRIFKRSPNVFSRDGEYKEGSQRMRN